jgi:hypothetical protein
MALNNPNQLAPGWRGRSALKCGVAAFICSAFSSIMMAQDVLAPPPPDFSGLPPALRTTGTNQPGEIPPLAPSVSDEPLLQLGPVQIRPHFLYRFLYGDGISAQPGEQLKTAIHELYPGIFLRLGDHWSLDYTPVLRLYSNNHFRDTTDHSVSLNGATIYDDWTLGFSQSYFSSSEPLAATAAQTDQEFFATALTAIYQMSSAASLELGANQFFRVTSQTVPGESLTDTRSWSSMDWFNYRFSGKIAAALGAGFGYDNVSAGSDMTSEQIQGRIIWQPGAKLTFSASGGAEIRQVLDSDAPDLVTPIFGVSAQYQLFESTALGLGANRVVSPSLFLNQVTEITTITVNLHQRLLKKLSLDLSGGYVQSSYRFTIFGFTLAREDEGTYFNARLSAAVLKRATAAIFFQTSDNSSTASDFAFSSTQVGFELGYRF